MMLSAFAANNAIAQFSAKIDSLISLAEVAPDSIGARLNNDVCWKLRNMNPDIALRFGMKAIDIARRIGDNEQLVKGYAFVGVCHRNLDNFADALEYYKLGIDLAIKFGIKDQLGYGYINLGNLLIHENKFVEAEKELEKALPIALEIKDSAVLAYVYLNMGRTRLAARDYDKSEEYFMDALDIRLKCKKLNHQCNVVRKYLADCHAAAGLVGLARKEYMTTLSNVDIIGDYDLLSELTINLANQFYDEKNYDSALVYAHRSLDYSKHLGSKNAITTAYDLIINIYSIQNLDKELADIYINQVECNDSIFNSKLEQSVFNIKYSANSYKKQVELSALSDRKKIQTIFTIGFTVLVLLGVGILFVYIVNNKKVKKLNTELDKQRNALAISNKEITSSIRYAHRIQNAVLNTLESVRSYFPDSMIYFNSKDIVSGDWYRIESRRNYKIIAVGDCTGHGVPGSLLSMMGVSALKDAINSIDISGDELLPASILNRMRIVVKSMVKKNGDVEKNINDGMSMSLGIIDTDTNMMKYACALQIIIHVRNSHVSQLKGDRMPVGNYVKENDFTNYKIQLQSGDALFFPTDGIKDQTDERGQKFLGKRLLGFVADNSRLPMSQVGVRFDAVMKKWCKGAEQLDDMTMIGIRIA